MLATSWHIQKANPQKATKAPMPIIIILIINFMIQTQYILICPILQAGQLGAYYFRS
jgi:hypothetical protein